MRIIIINASPVLWWIAMSFDIEARIENGQPSLRILDADSQAVRLAWSCPACEEPCAGPEGLALQRLFRELFLLSLIEKLKPGDRYTPSAPPPVPSGTAPVVQ
jgi:hypothetical protein